MTGRLIARYLADRIGLILVFYLNTALILTLVGLLLSFQGGTPAALRANLGYALLLSTVLLLLYLAGGLVQWWPFARHVQGLLDREEGLEALSSLPSGGTGDQAAFRGLIGRLYALAAAERLRYEAAHQRHLTFMTLWVHQMKTPVSAISLLAQQAGGQDPDELRAAVAGVDEEAAKLADGLELVLHMARLQEFHPDYHIRRSDLLQSLRQIINDRKRQFIRLAIYPEVEAVGTEWAVLTDPKWNRFVLEQIVNNALKYASQAGPPGQRLRFRLERAAQAVTLTIADQGPGIPPQDLPRVFEPFFTGENGRRYADATGIGLYLVKQVLDRLDHRIAIDAVDGQGTAVTLTYPVAADLTNS